MYANLRTDGRNDGFEGFNKRIESRDGNGYYTTGKTIGQGAYAVVKSCVHHPSQCGFAVKIFDKLRSNWETRKKLVYREVKLMEKICHSNDHIVKFREYCDGNTHLHLVMEEVNAGNLRQELTKRRRLGEPKVRNFFWQICTYALK